MPLFSVAFSADIAPSTLLGQCYVNFPAVRPILPWFPSKLKVKLRLCTIVINGRFVAPIIAPETVLKFAFTAADTTQIKVADRWVKYFDKDIFRF